MTAPRRRLEWSLRAPWHRTTAQARKDQAKLLCNLPSPAFGIGCGVPPYLSLLMLLCFCPPIGSRALNSSPRSPHCPSEGAWTVRLHLAASIPLSSAVWINAILEEESQSQRQMRPAPANMGPGWGQTGGNGWRINVNCVRLSRYLAHFHASRNAGPVSSASASASHSWVAPGWPWFRCRHCTLPVPAVCY